VLDRVENQGQKSPAISLEGGFRCAHFSSQRGIRRLGLIEKEGLQPVEMVQTSMLYELGPESVHDSVEHLSAQRRSKIRSGVSVCAGSR
jgi:hypothetical protein